MLNQYIQSRSAAAFASIFSALLLVSASVLPAVGNIASLTI